ncbi:MFS transporter [Virgibacillus dokdonensis]|uniref:MFS transporter n=1 Tax=Virgibacillus dokdonensis TaxID=302167 RepID=A0ABU7VCE6_9BACI|nr:MFS transporter [Virgibacillus dokdonensis]
MNEQLNHNQSAQKHGKNVLLILTLAFSVLLSGVTVDMVTPVLGLIGNDLGASEAQTSWIVGGVALVLAIAIPFYGRIADFVEARKLFTIGVLILTLGNLIAALATELNMLVIGRMIQGAGMASVSVVSIIVISRVYPPGQRGIVLGIVAGSIGIGTAGGPIFGGLVGQWLGWKALFWITFTLGILIAISAQISMQKIYPLESEKNKTFDVIGGISLGLMIGFFLLGITLSENQGLTSYLTMVCLGVSFVALVILTIRIRTASNPFIPPILLKNRAYVRSVLIIFLSMFAYFPILVFIPLLVVEVNGFSPGEAGMLLLPGGAAVAILSPIIGRLSDRIKHEFLLIAGLLCMGGSTFFLSTFSGGSPITLSMGVLGSGIAYALINSPANNFAVSTLNKEQVGVGMGLFQGALFLGTGVGSALMGTFLALRRKGENAINPIYDSHVPHYSDVFFALTVITMIALVSTFRISKKIG